MVVKLTNARVVVVLKTCVQVVPLSVDDSHLLILPFWPDKVMFPPLLPAHAVTPPSVVPPTVGVSSMTVTELEFGGQGAAGVIVQVNV